MLAQVIIKFFLIPLDSAEGWAVCLPTKLVRAPLCIHGLAMASIYLFSTNPEFTVLRDECHLVLALLVRPRLTGFALIPKPVHHRGLARAGIVLLEMNAMPCNE